MFAEDGAASDSGEVETVRVIGNLSDGTPPPPAPPRELPELTVLDTSCTKGRTLADHQKVLPPDLPEPPHHRPHRISVKRSFRLVRPGPREVIETRFALVSATVYDHEKTLVRCGSRRPRTESRTRNFEAWSNIDFLHLTGFGSFEYEGITYSLLMAAGAIDTEAWRERMASSGRELELPESPELPADRPTYVVPKRRYRRGGHGDHGRPSRALCEGERPPCRALKAASGRATNAKPRCWRTRRSRGTRCCATRSAPGRCRRPTRKGCEVKRVRFHAAVAALMPALLSYPARAADFTIEAKDVAGTTVQYVEVTWPAEGNWLYFAQASETIEEGSWQYLPEAIVGAPDTLGVLTFFPERPEEPDTRFLRVIRTEDLGGDGMSQDNDYDDLPNAEEFANLTDPLNRDTDGDGLLDGFEVNNGLDPLDDGTGDINNGPQGDPDGDGWTNCRNRPPGRTRRNRHRRGRSRGQRGPDADAK